MRAPAVAIILLSAAIASVRADDGVPRSFAMGTGEWAPLSGSSLPGEGLMCELVAAAFGAAGVKVSFEFYPWRRCESLLDEGVLLGIVPYSVTDERRAEHLFSDSILVERTQLFYLRDKLGSLSFDRLSDLRKYRIGGVLGNWYEKRFADAGLAVDYVSDDRANLSKLLGGRIDLFVAGSINGWYLVHSLPPDLGMRISSVDVDIDTAASPAEEEELGLRIMASKANPLAARMIEEFNKGLREIRGNGTFSHIMARYGLGQ